jgi:hypothetical protein
MSVRRTASCVVAVWLTALVACRGTHDSPVVDHGTVGAFVYDESTSWGVDKTRVEVGVPWSAGSVTLCKRSAGDRVVLTSISPISLKGDVRLDGIGVRTTHYANQADPATEMIGTLPGVPPGLSRPAGFVATSTCPGPRRPVLEIVVTLTKTGPAGGALDGLRIEYTEDSVPHELTIRFHYGLCGTGQYAVRCAPG